MSAAHHNDFELERLTRDDNANDDESSQDYDPDSFQHVSPRKIWPQIESIVLETAPTLLLTTVSLLFTGKLLDQVSHWRAMLEVDQLIMIIPVILNLKGNLEMNLSARLGTAANVGELDEPEIRRSMVLGNLSLLQVQATGVSFIAACVSFVLGFIVPGNQPPPPDDDNDPVSLLLFRRRPLPPLPHNGRRSGFAEFIMVASTSMTAACLSSLILGSFMCFLIVMCRKFGRDPDNIAPPIASCLGDLITLILLGLTSTLLIPFLHPSTAILSVIPGLLLIGIVISASYSLYLTRQNEHVRDLIFAGWTPLLGAMVISSATGIVLDLFVSRYEGFALLAVVISGLPGSVGSIFVSRMSTSLHAAALAATTAFEASPLSPVYTALHRRSLSGHLNRPLMSGFVNAATPLTADFENMHDEEQGANDENDRKALLNQREQQQNNASHSSGEAQNGNNIQPPPTNQPSTRTVMLTLLFITLPVEVIFLTVLHFIGWLKLPFLFVGFSIVFFCVAVISALVIAQQLTTFLWNRGLDPDMYAMPIHSALMDLIGQLLLVLCFEIVSMLGAKVQLRKP